MSGSAPKPPNTPSQSRLLMMSLVYALGWLIFSPVQAIGSLGPTLTTRQFFFPRESTPASFNASQIPDQCQSKCDSILDNANNCTTFQCICTPANDAALLACVNCVASANSSATAIVAGQDILNQFAMFCNLNNFTISSLSASGIATVTDATTSNFIIPPSSEGQLTSATSPLPGSPTTLSASGLSVSPSSNPNSALSTILSGTSVLWPIHAAIVMLALVVTYS
ncbi:hypothetical protein R3P38DRAFT_474756 [Favolaschia claudopus]|uniref:Extracellular membrane protein CFEM domain-containing protein n=1 Tax=Favolaschia claudopus TaxID=2862362 RepID=A0AAW0CJZ6_9AGAR